MAIYRYNNPTVANASSAAAFKTFLDGNKAGTFLENLTISTSGSGANTVLTISDGTSSFTHANTRNDSNPALSDSRGYVRFANASVNMEISDAWYDSWQRCYIVGAILCRNGLIINTAYALANSTQAPTATANISIGSVMLTIDSNGDLCAVFTSDLVNHAAISVRPSPRAIVKESISITTISLAPTYSTQKTAIFPIVINTNSGNTTIPKFYTALQTELPSLGLQAVQIELSNYITNGYCFIKDGV